MREPDLLLSNLTDRALTAATVLTLAWGAASFGAVYPWGYGPLLVASASIGIFSLLMRRIAVPGLVKISLALGMVAAVVALQLVPISAARLARANPARDALIRRYDVLYAWTSASHPLSVDPASTALGLTCFAAFALLLVGIARTVSARGAMGLVRGIVLVGTVLAAFAIVQNVFLVSTAKPGQPFYIYGFWPDPYENKPFGPFINKNNFAGWMLMALSLGIGYVAATLTRAWRRERSDWRSRILALSTSAGAETLLAALGIIVMSVALVASLSRSAMIALAATALGFAWFAPRGEGGRGRARNVTIAVVVLAVVVVIAGPTTIAERFGDRSDASMAGRVTAWRNAARLAAAFPVIGIGLNAFPVVMLLDQRGDPLIYWEEAHCDYLQLAAETGILGTAAIVAALAVIGAGVRSRFREERVSDTSFWLRVGAVTGIAAIGIQELVEFSLQIPANAALFAVLVGVALHRHHRPASRRAAVSSQ